MSRRTLPDWQHEQELGACGFRAVAGVDEAGRGSLAGPVAAAAVILPCSWLNPGVDDSKRLTPARREQLARQIRTEAQAWALGLVSAAEIDVLNIHQASLLAMGRALSALEADYALLDGRFTLPGARIPQQALIKGDQRSCSVAAASIVAKVERDRIMDELHRQYPAYCFQTNKGYPTKAHLAALRAFGPCPEHRRSYGPVTRLGFVF
jgi:ribonuclease HII